MDPSVRGIQEDSIAAGHVDAGCDRVGRRDRLQRRRRSFRCRPSDEAAVARALHADAAVAPGLLCDPRDDCARVVAVGLERRARTRRRVAGDARKREHAGVAVGCGLSRIAARSIERELEQRRQRAAVGRAPRADQRRRDRRVLRNGDRDLFDDVTPSRCLRRGAVVPGRRNCDTPRTRTTPARARALPRA